MMKKGFTLIEMVVVVGVLGVMMIAIMAILGGAFSGKKRLETANNVEKNGTYILDELRKISLETWGGGVTCPAVGVGNEVTMASFRSGGITTFVCEEGVEIASESAVRSESVVLSGTGIRVSGCSSFVSCDTQPSTEVSALNFKFTLSLGNTGYGAGEVTREFQSRVVVRN